MYLLKSMIEMSVLWERYPFTEQMVRVAGRDWNITTVKDEDTLIRRVQTDADLNQFPYGLMLWPSAIGLAESLARNPDRIRGQRTLEIGAGIGLAGIVARWLGADVTQTDYQAEILSVCRHNADRNSISGIHQTRGDWRDWPEKLIGFDRVIGSDVLYEPELHETLTVLLPQLVRPGGKIVISDPLRAQALKFVERLEQTGRWQVTVEGLQVDWEGRSKDVGIFILRLL